MKVKDLIEKLQKCDPDDQLKIIQEEELECMPEWWDDNIGEYGGVTDKVTELFSEDLYSHQTYLLAIRKRN